MALLDRLCEVDPGATKANLLKAMVIADAYPGAPFDLAAAAEAAKLALAMNLEDSGPALVEGCIALMAGDLERARLAISARHR